MLNTPELFRLKLIRLKAVSAMPMYQPFVRALSLLVMNRVNLATVLGRILQEIVRDIYEAQSAGSEDSFTSTSAGTDELMPGLVPYTPLTRCRSYEHFARKNKDCFEQQDVMRRWMRRCARSL